MKQRDKLESSGAFTLPVRVTVLNITRELFIIY